MKDSTRYLTFIQATLVSLVLAGCSSVNTTKEPTVRDVIAEVINDDTIAEKPSLTLVGSSIVNSSVRPHSNRSFHKNVKEPAVQGVQGHVLQANNALDVTPTYESQLNEPVTTRPEGLNPASQRHNTILVGDALKEVFSSNTTKEPAVEDTAEGVIAVVEVIDDDNIAEEPSSVLVGTVDPSVRSNSVWTSRKPLEPTVQGVQGHVLQASDMPDVKSSHKSQLNERVARRPERPNVTSQKHDTVLVGDALKEIFGGGNITQEPTQKPTVMDAVVEVIGESKRTENSSIE